MTHRTTLTIMLALALFAGFAFGQSNPTKPISGTTIAYNSLAKWSSGEPVSEWLVHYTTSELCLDCPSRYAIVCGPNAPNCGIPRVNVPHYESFPTMRAALEFMNNGLRRITTGSAVFSGDSGTLQSVWEAPAEYPREFVRLLKVYEQPVETEKTTESIPQPAKTIESTKYSVR